MPCDTKLKPKQTLSERKEEVRAAAEKVAKGLAAGRIKAIISREGAIAFAGLTDTERDGVTDACLYRRVMAGGSALAKAAIARAEAASGRAVNRTALVQGHHSHDGGKTWHRGH